MIYADNAATTRVSEKVLRVMTRIMAQEYGDVLRIIIAHVVKQLPKNRQFVSVYNI